MAGKVNIELSETQARELSRELEHLVYISPATFYDPQAAISKLRALLANRHS